MNANSTKNPHPFDTTHPRRYYAKAPKGCGWATQGERAEKDRIDAMKGYYHKISLILGLFMGIKCLGSVTSEVQTIKFRIANPFEYGVMAVLIPQLNPQQLDAIYYIAPKTSYFAGSLDMFVLPIDLVGLVGTKLDGKATDAEIEQARSAVIQQFAAGQLAIWRIAQFVPGLTKVFLTLQKEVDGTFSLMPNQPVQSGSPVEIEFERWVNPFIMQIQPNQPVQLVQEGSPVEVENQEFIMQPAGIPGASQP